MWISFLYYPILTHSYLSSLLLETTSGAITVDIVVSRLLRLASQTCYIVSGIRRYEDSPITHPALAVIFQCNILYEQASEKWLC